MTTTKRITLATIKSFIRKNEDKLFISVESKFDGMVDCMRHNEDSGFTPALKDTTSSDYWLKRTLGIQGAWFVGESRDYFSAFDKDGFKGYHVWNSCGSFTLAVKN